MLKPNTKVLVYNNVKTFIFGNCGSEDDKWAAEKVVVGGQKQAQLSEWLPLYHFPASLTLTLIVRSFLLIFLNKIIYSMYLLLFINPPCTCSFLYLCGNWNLINQVVLFGMHWRCCVWIEYNVFLSFCWVEPPCQFTDILLEEELVLVGVAV